MKLTIEDCWPWLTSINEVAQMQNMDIKTASISISQELSSYRQLGGIKKEIQRANQELTLINMQTMKKQEALTVLNDLTDRGATSEEIAGLVDFAAQWYLQSNSLQQPFRHVSGHGCIGNGNLQQLGSNGNNSHDGNLSTNDLKLLLLKSNNTNILNRMGASAY